MAVQLLRFAVLVGLFALGMNGALALGIGQECSATRSEPGYYKYRQTIGSSSVLDPLLSGADDEEFRRPNVAALFDLTYGCCPNDTFISEWEATIKTFKAPPPFGDGRIRSLNGTILDEYIAYYSSGYSENTGLFDYSDWNTNRLGNETGDSWYLTWEDVQGIALSTLHNVTVLGSLSAKCSDRNGTIVAALPVVGSNLTEDCLDPPGLEVIESEPIRIINSTFSDGSFENFLYDNNLKLPKYTNESSDDLSPASDDDDTLETIYGFQESPYRDFMGLMRIQELDAENAPDTVDVAQYPRAAVDSLRRTYLSDQRASYLSYTADELFVSLSTWYAANGFAAIEGCYGPVEVQVYASRKRLDVVAPLVTTSYSACAHESSSSNTDYKQMGTRLEDYTPGDYTTGDENQFPRNPLICCPDGEYVSSFNLEFSGDPAYASPELDGSFAKQLWGITANCSKGTILPTITGGNGCAGSANLLPASNYTVQIPYGNQLEGSLTRLQYRLSSIDGGFSSFAGVSPNNETDAFPLPDSVYFGTYDTKQGGWKRIVGLDATASCNSLNSVGIVLRTLDQIGVPTSSGGGGGGGGGLSGGAIAGIVIGAVAAVALWAFAVFLIFRSRRVYRGSGAETLPMNAKR